MTYEVLSPCADVDPIRRIGLNPRVTDLSKATIGLYAYFKAHWALILEEIAKQIHERYPGATFTRFHYAKDLNSHTDVAELAEDPEVRPRFEEWVKGVDTVLMANGDAGSCTLYLTGPVTAKIRLPEHWDELVARYRDYEA